MKVLNRHSRTYQQPKTVVAQLLKTLATKDDRIWPQENWPAMRFENGLQVGSHGGHGIIRYSVAAHTEGEFITFNFTQPRGFIGYHKFQVNEISYDLKEVVHEIRMETKGLDTLKWIFVIRWLHDALAENALDRIANHFSEKNKRTPWSLWVKFWRLIFKLKSKA